MPIDPPLARNAWLIVGLLWVVGCLNYLDRVMLITMRISIKESIPMTDAQFGLLTTVFLFVYGALSGFGGFIADRFSCSRIIVFSLGAWSATTWLTAHATTYNELLFSRALMGLSEACYLPAAGALIALYHGNATRSLANGIHLSGVMVGSGLGGIGGWLAEHHGWTFAFRLFGAIGVGYCILLVLFLRDPVKDAATASVARAAPRIKLLDALRSLLGRRDFIIALFFWALLGITSWAFAGWMPTYLSEHFNLAEGKSGLIATGFIYSGSLLGMIVSGAWADRWSRRHPEARAWVGVIGLIVCIPCVIVVASTGVLGITMAALVVFGFTRAFPDANMMPILFQITDPRYRATGLGLLNAAGVFAGGLTIYVGGMVRDAHIDITRVFYGGAIGLAVCGVLLWIMRPRVIDPQ